MKRLKGLHRDSNPMDQPAGTYRYSKNMVLDIAKSAIVSESGDLLKSTMTGSSFDIVGYCVLDTNEIVIFSTNGTHSEIGTVNVDTASYVTVYNDSAVVAAGGAGLNFNINHPIEAEYKINATDDTSIYFTDDNNPPRFINLTDPPDSSNAFLDIEVTFSLFPVLTKYPKIALESVGSGGTLNCGTYYITSQLVTQDGATTNILDISNPIYINPDSEASGNVEFGIGEDYTPNIYSGADAGTGTNKKITMSINNLDFENYQFLRPIVIIQVAGSRSAVSLPDIPVTTSNLIFSYTGYEEVATFNLAEIQVARASYTKAKAIAQVDDVLYLGNLVRSKVDLGYQKFANNIKIQSVQLDPNGGANDVGSTFSNTWNRIVKAHSQNGFTGITHDGIFKSTDNNAAFGRTAYDNYYFKGYQRDETYAFYITWILKDGSESIAYHIPGRAPQADILPDTNNKTEDDVYDYSGAYYAGNSGNLNAALGSSIKFFHVDTHGAVGANGRGMGYWENASESYPTAANDPNNDFLVFTVDANGNSVQVPGISLHGQKVRHHHFPAESQVIDQTASGSPGSFANLYDQGGGMIWDGTYSGGATRVRFNPLGFKAYDIPFPNEIKDLVLGYKIYYANRDSQNATVIDQGIVHNVRPLQGPLSGGDDSTFDDPTYIEAFPLGQFCGHGTGMDASRFVFDGYHSLITGDSIEGANIFKAVRHQFVGTLSRDTGNTGSGDYNWWGIGIRHFTEDSAGDTIQSNRAGRWFVDWCRMRPSTVGGPDARGVFFRPFNSDHPGNATNVAVGLGQFLEIDHAQPNTASNFYYAMPISDLSYIPANSVNNTIFPGTSFDNTNGTQTVGLKLTAGYNAQGYFARANAFSNMFTNPFGIYSTAIVAGDTSTHINNQQGGPSAFSHTFSSNEHPRVGGNGTNNTQTSSTNDNEVWVSYNDNDNVMVVHNGPGTGTITGDEDFQDVSITFARRNASQAAIFTNLYAARADIYSNFESQSDLVYTGHLYKTDALNAATVINPTSATAETVMGGDTFLGMVAITKSKKSPLHETDISPSGDQFYTHVPLGVRAVTSSSVDNYQSYCTHLFPTESRSHIAMREQDMDVSNSYFFPRSDNNHRNLITEDGGFSKNYDFNDDYNSENNVKILSIFDHDSVVQGIDDFPTRIIRSLKYNQSGVTDNFRVFLAAQYRDLPRHRGELWRLESMKSLLVAHMERSLMVTRGKEELSVGSVAAALGSGDLFERDPVEVLTTERGEGGTQSQFAGLVTRHGYFFVDINAHKVYMYGQSLEEISAYGMSDWFRENLKHPLANYTSAFNADIPTAGVGAVAGYDPDLDRILLTFKYVDATQTLIDGLESVDATNNIRFSNSFQQFVLTTPAVGPVSANNLQTIPIDWNDSTYFTYKYWTISYYPSMKAWGSFHDYNPIFYPYTTKHLTKIDSNNSIYIPSRTVLPGQFLTTDTTNLADIEFEFIDNLEPAITKLFFNVNWTIDAQNNNTEQLVHDPSFSHLYVYNTHQMSRETAIIPFAGSFSSTANTRRIERGWQFNNFRDDTSLLTANTVTNVNAAKFNIDGMNITQNTGYLDLTKPYHQRKKFIDKYLGVRLLDKTSNLDRKVIYLYLADASKRKVYR